MYILISVFIVVAISWFLFRKKSGAALSDKKVAFGYRELLLSDIGYFQKLSNAEKDRFENMVNEFLQNVNIEGVGTEITDLDKVRIASSAIIPVFGLGTWHYKNLTNIILYPDTFDGEFQFEGENRNILGMVGSGYLNGQMLLSRKALEKGFSKTAGKENAAIHEFVHLLDKSDGATDGLPENLINHEYVLPWLNMMHQEMRRISSGKSDINPYALTNEAEFFAVAAEYFFEKPEKFRRMHPDLYQHLSVIFKQEPLA